MSLTQEKKNSINIGDIELSGYVYIPPMAGFTDYVYRQLCRGYDPDVLMSTEMLSSKAMMYEKERSKKMEIPEGESLTGIQVFGHEPEVMANAARIATEGGARFIDINMGCPVPKITKSMDGAALMKEPELAVKIVKAVMAATHLPVTVKTRLGWCYDSINSPELAKSFEDCGVKALTIHGRTRSQKYKGDARWDLIKDVVDAVSIPVFANGDVRTADDAKKALEITGAAGVAIARGTMGRPWLSKQINHFLQTGEKLPEPNAQERCELALKHCKMLIDYKGQKVGSNESRKHIVNYTSGLKGASKLRAKLSQMNSYEDAKEALEEVFEHL